MATTHSVVVIVTCGRTGQRTILRTAETLPTGLAEREREQNHGPWLHCVLGLRYNRSFLPGADVVGCLERRVDATTPCLSTSRRNGGQLEHQWLPVCVEHHVELKAGAQTSKREGQRVRALAPVGASEFHAVPLQPRAAKQTIEAVRPALRHNIAALAKAV